jgi:hypothetical protein
VQCTQLQKNNQIIIEQLLTQNPKGLSMHELASLRPGLKLAEAAEAVNIMKAGCTLFELNNKLFLIYRMRHGNPKSHIHPLINYHTTNESRFNRW